MAGDDIHTCHPECPCHTGDEPIPDFTPGGEPPYRWEDYYRRAAAERDRQRDRYVDALERAAHFQEQYALAVEELERLRAALRRIADAESGHWGWIAHEALHPKERS
jgi:hypothetical protein